MMLAFERISAPSPLMDILVFSQKSSFLIPQSFAQLRQYHLLSAVNVTAERTSLVSEKCEDLSGFLLALRKAADGEGSIVETIKHS